MHPRRVLILWAALVLLQLLLLPEVSRAQSGSASIFYTFDVVAAPGQAGLTNPFIGPSINDNGVVALAGQMTGGTGLFVGDGRSPLRNIVFSNRIISGGVQINNSGWVIVREFVPGTNPPQTIIRRWDANTPGTNVIIAYANGAGAFNDFDDVWPNPSVNNNNQAAFNARRMINNYLVTGITPRPNFNEELLPNAASTLRPMVADDGKVVVRAGGLMTDPIRLYKCESGVENRLEISTTYR